jgi:hypothetical protein
MRPSLLLNTIHYLTKVMGAPPRGESIMTRYALRSDQLRTKAASLILPQMALRD